MAKRTSVRAVRVADPSPTAADRLRAFVQRVERLEEERKAINVDIREIYAEAKSAGFDTKAMVHFPAEEGIGAVNHRYSAILKFDAPEDVSKRELVDYIKGELECAGGSRDPVDPLFKSLRLVTVSQLKKIRMPMPRTPVPIDSEPSIPANRLLKMPVEVIAKQLFWILWSDRFPLHEDGTITSADYLWKVATQIERDGWLAVAEYLKKPTK